MRDKLNTNVRSMLACLFACALCLCLLPACAGSEVSGQEGDTSQSTAETTRATSVRIVSPKGPLSVGLVSAMSETAADQDDYAYRWIVASSFGEVATAMSEGSVDIAIMQPSIAYSLYESTEGAVSVVAISSLSSYSIVSGDGWLAGLPSLVGKTLYLESSSSELYCSLRVLLERAGLLDAVTLERSADAAEAVAHMSSDKKCAAVLSEPYASAALVQGGGSLRSVSLSDSWDGLIEGDSRLVGGVVVVSNSFMEQHPEIVEEFLEELAGSAEFAAVDPLGVMGQVVDAGVIDTALVSEQGIVSSRPVCITGDEMVKTLSGYFEVMSSYGYSEEPDEGFYAVVGESEE